jgi:Zn-dependent peptidase ImmA (M78 family)/DNA-binding XRE family transcriptional regulator
MDTRILEQIDPRVLGARLQDARKAAGMTQQDVARHLDMARTTIVAIEKGGRRVNAHELVRLAALYGRGVSEFVSRKVLVEGFVPQFRATERELMDADPALERAAVELQRLAEDYLELERITKVPLSKSYPPPYDTSGTTPEQIGEEVATAERNRLGIGDGPIGNLRDRLENDVGLRVFYLAMPPRIAGMFAYNDEIGGAISINLNHPRDRRQWSLAHEYGHFLTTRYQPEITVLHEKRRTSFRERVADSFAAAFLMPASGLNRRFTDLNRASEKGITLAHICSLADLYQVSVQALILRLEDLRRLSIGTWERLAIEGFKVQQAEKLLSIDANPPLREHLPRRYVDLAIQAYRKGYLSEGQLSRFLRTDRVSARMEVEEFNRRIHREQDGEFPGLDLDLALPLPGR